MFGEHGLFSHPCKPGWFETPQERLARGVWLEGDRDHPMISLLHVALWPWLGLQWDTVALLVSLGGWKLRPL